MTLEKILVYEVSLVFGLAAVYYMMKQRGSGGSGLVPVEKTGNEEDDVLELEETDFEVLGKDEDS